MQPQIDMQERNRELILSIFATTGGTNTQSEEAARNDDSFSCRRKPSTNPDFQHGLELFQSPDGKAARMIVTHQGNPGS